MSARAYGECARSGERVSVDDLVEDGQNPGLKVARWHFDPKHPQEIMPRLKPERHQVPAPELSKPAGEGEAAPALGFDALGNVTFST